MKIQIASAIIMAIIVCGSGCKTSEVTAKTGSVSPEVTVKTGSFSAASVSRPEVIAAADFAIKTTEKEMRKVADTKSAKLTLVKIQSAQKQVVSGMNYRISLKVNLNGTEKTAEAIVWHQAWRKPGPYKLTSWTWK